MREALDGRRGETVDGVDLRRFLLENRQDSIEKPDNSSENSIYRIRMDFNIWFVQSVPTF